MCVTQQKTCERLIHEAVKLLEKYNGTLHVLHVAKNNWKFLDNDREGEALDYLFSISKNVGANLTVLRSEDITGTIKKYVIDNGIGCIVLGESPEKNSSRSIISKLERTLIKAEIKVIPQ